LSSVSQRTRDNRKYAKVSDMNSMESMTKIVGFIKNNIDKQKGMKLPSENLRKVRKKRRWVRAPIRLLNSSATTEGLLWGNKKKSKRSTKGNPAGRFAKALSMVAKEK
jgi:hypothetical protein